MNAFFRDFVVAMIDLSGKTAFITGASRGIGEATARKMASYGAKVILTARTTADIERIADDIGDSALAIACDVSDHASVRDAISQGVSAFGSLDYCVNNAGTIEPIARIEDSSAEDWSRVMDINTKGVYNVMRYGYEHLVDGGGVIINISSGAATNALEGWSHYCASKAAVLSLTKCGHKEWHDKGVHVVGLSPGTVATDMQHVIKDSGVNPVSQLDWSNHISPEWVAEAIVWLTTDAARVHDGTDFSIKTEEGRRAVGLV